MKITKIFTAAAVVGAVAFGASDASAAGFALKEQSAKYQGSSFAGATANGKDASSVFFNPAGIAGIEKDFVIQVNGSLVMPRSDAEHASSSSLAFGAVPGIQEGDIGQDALVPATYVAARVNDKVNVGVGVNAPFGLTTTYDENWVGRYEALTSSVRTINVTPTVSYKLADNLSIGAGAQIQHMEVRLSQASNCGAFNGGGAYASDCIVNNEGDDIGFGFTAGIQYEPVDGTKLGASFRSSVKHNLEGDVTFSGNTAGQLNPTGLKSEFKTPEMVNLGVVQDITDDFRVMGDATYTRWSRFKELSLDYEVEAGQLTDQTVPEDWKDVWFGAVGFEYDVDSEWTLRAGTAFDKSPISDARRTARIPGGDRIWGSVGASYEVENFAFDIGFSHIEVDNSSISEEASGVTDTALDAEYDSSIDILSVGLTVKF